MADTDRARWTRLVADFESADLSQREFAQERGVPLSSLRYWIYRLRKESRPLVTEAAGRSIKALIVARRRRARVCSRSVW
jgi:transposase